MAAYRHLAQTGQAIHGPWLNGPLAETIEFAGQDFTSNRWSVDPQDLAIAERA